MAKQAAGTHQPLSYRAHVRLRALHKNLHSKFQAVRAAAAREIQAILNKKRGVQNRLREWAVNTTRATVRKVTPSQLHKPLRVHERAAQASKRGQATPIRAHMPKGGFTPLTDHTLTRAELRQRTKAARQARRSGQPQPAGRQGGDGMEHLRGLWQGYHSGTYGARGSQQPQARRSGQPAARQPDAMQQATETMRRAHQQPQGARSPGRPGQTSPFTEHRPSAPSQGAPESETQRAVRDINNVFARHYPDVQPMPEPRGQDGARSAQQPSHDGPAQRKRAADNARWHEVTKAARREDAQAGRPGGPDGPPLPTQAERVSREAARASRDIQNQNTPPERVGRAQAPPLPGDPEARLQPGEKRRWARVPKNAGGAPERTRSSRTRNRTTA